MDLGRACKLTKSCRRIIKKWRLDRFEVRAVMSIYQRALEEEVKGFSESIRQKMKKGLKSHALVSEVLRERGRSALYIGSVCMPTDGTGTYFKASQPRVVQSL